MKPSPSILTIACASAIEISAAPRPVDYIRDIRPILREKCYVCHGPGMENHNLRLDLKTSAMRVLIPARHGEVELVRRITSSAADYRMPPPMAAPLLPDEIDILVSWIRQGVDWPDENRTPAAVRELFQAIDENRLGTVRRLLDDRSLAGARGPDLTTPLMRAALTAGPAVLDLLLRKGADPNATDPGGATALLWAVHDRQKVRRLLTAGANVNAKTKLGTTALIAATAFPQSAIVVKHLLAAGADPNAANADGATALSGASAAGNLKSMRLLLANRADPRLAPGALSPLSAAAYSGHRSAVKLLLDRGVGANERDGYGATALHAAALMGETTISELLIKHGADPNLTVEKPLPSGQQLGTPLVFSAYSQPGAAIAELLIGHGADVHAVTTDGESALKRAQAAGSSKLVEVLTKAGARGESGPRTQAALNDPGQRPATDADLRSGVERTLPLLLQSGLEFVSKSGCISCHSQHLPVIALALARKRGFRFDETQAQQLSEITRTALGGLRDRALQMMFVGGATGLGYAFLELAATGVPASSETAAYLRNLAAQQLPSGNWRPAGARPPQEFSDVTATALSIRAVQLYGCKSPEWPSDCRTPIRRAQSWLLSVEPSSTEDATFQLLGLLWAGTAPKSLHNRVRKLALQQRRDGGWAQLPTLPSDAYATGQVLYALHEAGALRVSDPAVRNGVQFLLRTQRADGSWLVPSRTLRFQPHFESGFPHGPDQFISVAGTSWAAMALMLAFEPAITRTEKVPAERSR